MKAAVTDFDRDKAYPLTDAIEMLSKSPKVKFDETVELHFHLNIDPKSSEESVRGTVMLPHGTGKKIRIAVFARGEQIQQAKDLGADHVGDKELIDKVAGGFMDFDCVIATPEMMRDISKLGKALGPRGLMPSPKAGTVTTDIARAIKDVKAGKIEFKSDKQAGIHVGIGKRSFKEEELLKNARQVIDSVNHAKPSAVKINLIRSLFVSSTMGPSVRVAL
jgi:large subunit ribosomal protein L1